MSRKDDEVAAVARQLDGLLDALRANVDALSEILTRPAPPEGGGADERLAVP
jgi:hypothetical protein